MAMDMSDLFKNHLTRFYKATHVTKTVKDRKEDLQKERKSKRETLAFARRNIDVNMSPITPGPAETIITRQINRVQQKNYSKTKNDGVNKRLEMLAKWKTEKAKKKQLERANKKPIFKVCHVDTNLAINLENVNKLIKGKAILSSAIKKSQFAPPDHKFRPPNGIKPINFNVFNTHNKISETMAKTNTRPHKGPATPKSSKLTVSRAIPQLETEVNHKMHKGVRALKQVQLAEDQEKGTKKPSASSTSKTSLDSVEQINKTRKPSVAAINSNRPISHRRLNKMDNKCREITPKASTRTDLKESRRNGLVRSRLSKSLTETKENRNYGTYVKSKGRSESEEFSEKNVAVTAKTPTKTEPKNRRANAKKSPSETPVETKKKKNIDTNVTSRIREPCEKNEAATPTGSKKSRKKSAKKSLTKTPTEIEEEQKINNIVKLGNEEPLEGKEVPSEVPVYISPFVTISRGKHNAREEYKVRHSYGKENLESLTPELRQVLSRHTSPQAGADYFMVKMDSEIDRLNEICEQWESYLKDPELPEEAHSSIGVAIGQSKLLITKKFEQFRGLIAQCKTKQYEEKTITCEDLHGFWDMTYMQVKNLDQRFDNLNRLKANNWTEMLPEKKPVVKKTRKRTKTAKPTASSLKSIIRAARQKQKALKNGLEANEEAANDDCFSTRTPLKEQPIPQVPTRSTDKKKNLRLSVVNQKRCSSSPGLTMMKISQSIKQGNGLTPAKSILKSDGSKSTGKKSVAFREAMSPNNVKKTILFNEEVGKTRRSLGFHEDDKENTPRILRRSLRLAK